MQSIRVAVSLRSLYINFNPDLRAPLADLHSLVQSSSPPTKSVLCTRKRWAEFSCSCSYGLVCIPVVG